MIRLSATAANEIKRLQSKNPSARDGALRVSVQSKGCAGLSYELGFDGTVQADDRVFECDSIRVVVHPHSLAYVDGLTLDYSEDLMGGSFRFHNPNAKQTCSCGHSFSVESGTYHYQI
ncbi:HesB/IscA family protein [Altericista sp. CCNU0014]|uniref:HesB/IscA family protein n=1 Tax=Altericista sp. CCNU0014 TaxID=3082949 RepID=UPI00384D9627